MSVYKFSFKIFLFISILLNFSFVSSTLAQDSEDAPIIVTGRSLDDTLKNLEDCLARACPPNEDIDASLDHAENLFVAGEYKQANKIIKASLKRNKKHAADYPIPVSDLYRSNGRVLEHMGRLDKSYFSVLKTRDILKEHRNEDNRRLLIAELAIASAAFKDGFHNRSKRKLKSIYAEASKHNLDDIAGFAKIREFNIDIVTAIRSKAGYNDVRQDILDYITQINDPNNQFTTAAQILLARLDRQLGNTETTQAVINQYIKNSSAHKPILIYADSIRLPPEKGYVSDKHDRWADIGFYVNANGRVEDIEILRLSGKDNWIEPIKLSLQSRRYIPKKDIFNDNGIGQYIIERFTYTSEVNHILFNITDTLRPTEGSRIKIRNPQHFVRILDLTIYD